MDFIAEKIWLPREHRHQERLQSLLQPYLRDRTAQRQHPVYDFLFAYYSFRPSHLLRWSPGPGVILEGAAANKFLTRKEFSSLEISFFSRFKEKPPPPGVGLDPQKLPAPRLKSFRWIQSMLDRTANRPAQYGCFGLHEWAMVYQSDHLRHARHPLRLPPQEIARTLERAAVRCSHFDAFRFFTPSARPFNQLQPTADTRLELEQRGCLHVNMDLYKWAYKLSPWIESELLADCFFLAWDIRAIDMRASPYDFSALGFEPICIETSAGRSVYEQAQHQLAERAQPLRRQLISAYRYVLAEWRQAGSVVSASAQTPFRGCATALAK